MLKRLLTLVILLSIVVSCLLYVFIGRIMEEPEIQIEYVLPDEPISDNAKRRSRYYATHDRTAGGQEEQNEPEEEQHELPDGWQHNEQDFNTSLAEEENHSPNEALLDESVQEIVSLEKRIAKLKQDREAGLTTYQETVDTLS